MILPTPHECFKKQPNSASPVYLHSASAQLSLVHCVQNRSKVTSFSDNGKPKSARLHGSIPSSACASWGAAFFLNQYAETVFCVRSYSLLVVPAG